MGKENCNSKKKIDVLSKNDYKRNCSTQKTKSPKNELNDDIQLSRSPQKLLNTSKLNTSTYCKTPKESRKIDNLIRHQNSNETLDKFLNENYKNGYKKSLISSSGIRQNSIWRYHTIARDDYCSIKWQ